MDYKQLEEILEICREIPDSGKRDKGVRLMSQAASESITYDNLRSLVESGIPEEKHVKKQDDKEILLKFTNKEISKIPMRFRKELIIEERSVKCRRRKSGRHTMNYELRYRRNGYNIAVSSNDIEEAKAKFIQVLKAADKGEQKVKSGVSAAFDKFAEYYFENYRKRKVAPKTLENDLYRYNNHIKPYFKGMPLKSISPEYCQKLLDGFAEKGQTKTNNEIYSLLNGIFKMAIAHGIIDRNPLAVVIVERHKCTHGRALTKAEEIKLIEGLKGTKYERLMALALYTGLRPNEYKTAKIEGDFIVAVNSKRKNGKVEYKKIPIIEKLRPYLKEEEEFDFPRLEYMRDNFNKILPDHILYDLRTTFYTRCEECGVAGPARDEFVGHSRGVLNETYSDLSDEYLLKEGHKLNW